MNRTRLKINIYNQTKSFIPNRKKLMGFIRHIFEKENYTKINSINVIIADSLYLQKLNKEFFRRNKPTNVISFNLGTVGEIYVSIDEVKLPADLFYYVAHGLLHIFGYDHKKKKDEKTMEKKCFKYLNEFLKFPYK
ncbi:MAG: rRNA maturation RNase YbeY [candidate division WOR-3 bacterium]|nr:rRNA maturation RNase YbeY [candidate division WOR-3 bacterium]